MLTRNAKLWLLAAGMLLAAACGPKKTANEPSAEEFGQYVKAFTGGIVADDAIIQVELAEDVVDPVTEGLFSFKPAIKGTVKWNNAQSVSFIPEEGNLKVGQTYNAVFALGKVIPGAPEKFSFGFTVKGRTVPEEVQPEPDNGQPFRVVQAVLKESSIEVTFSESPVNANVKGLIELTGCARSYVQAQDNTVLVHFEGRKGDMTLTLDKGLKGAGGSSLGESFVRTFSEEEEKPAVQLLSDGNILPDRQQLILPFKAVNLSGVEVRVIKIYEKNILMYLQDNDFGEDNSLRRSGRLVYHGDIPLDATTDLHKWNTHCIDLSGLFKQEPGAIYRIRLCFRQEQSLYGGKEPLKTLSSPNNLMTEEEKASWDSNNSYYWENFIDWEEYNWDEADDPTKPSYFMDADRFPAVLLFASDLGLMADYAGGKQLWVAATDLITAKPVPGAVVEAFDYQLQSIGIGKTDSKGLATLDVSRKPFAVVAKAGGSTAFLKVTGGNERSTSRFDVGGEVLKQGLKAFIYGERGVWRPGDTLHVTAIVADKGKTLPKGHPATLEVYTPAGQFYSKLTRKGTDGFYNFDIPTKADDPTGYWNAYLKVGGSSFNKVLHVETIKPNRLKINTSYGPEGQALEAGRKINVYTQAEWLAGGAAGGCSARAQMTLRRLNTSPFKGLEEYRFTDPSSNFSSAEYELYDTTLDADGEAAISLTLPDADGAPGMLNAFIVTSVTEPGGDESFTTESRLYSPYSAYAGIRVPEGDYLETDKDQTIRIAVVDAAGKRVKGHQLEYAVFKTGWNWWWDNPGGDLDAYVSGESVSKVVGGTVKSGSQDVTFSFRVDYPEWGRYLILVRDINSGHVSGRMVTVDWPEYRGRAGREDPESLTTLSFSMDKPSYKVGDKATVYIPAAQGGQALVTLENASGILQREWVATSAQDTPWSFTVTPEMSPNIYVQVTLLQPYGSTANDLPIRLWGVQRMQVENPGSHLEPVMVLPDVIHPEEPFLVKVSEKNGKPMTYTLAIVDEGLLDITAFKTPDPWSKMYKPEALAVTTWDMYDQVIGAFGGKMVPLASIGGDEENLKQARKDNRFNPVVLFRAPQTLEKGTDVIKLKLPMYVGSVRVMLVAGHDGAYGNLEKTVPVQNPLMVVTTLPRVLGTSEEVAVPVNVFAMEDGLKDVSVSIKVDGPVAVSGSAKQKLSFSGKGDKLVRFGMNSTADEGIAHITIQAEGNGHKASETIALEVRNGQPVITRTESFLLEKDATKALSAATGATLQLSAFPALDARQLYVSMRDYPYDCGEQLSSRGLTMLNLLPLLSEADATEARGRIAAIIPRLYSRQSADGGFSYWGGKVSDSWVSSMAGLFLTQASKAGFDVNAGVLKSWKSYQQKMSQAYRLAGSSAFSHLDKAFRLYTLAVAGSPSLSGMNRLREAGEIGDRARWTLASAYALSGKQSQADALLEGIGKEFPEYEPYNLTYGTSLRDKFLALEALVLSGRVNDALALAADAAPARHLSTQESAFAAIAYGRLLEKVPTQGIHATVGSTELAGAQSMIQTPVSGNVTVKNLSGGPLYATLCTPSRESMRSAVSNGLKVEVVYINADGRAIDPTSLSQGTRFKAVVKVTNASAGRNFENLALTVPVAAGWEIVNERLMGADEEAYDHKDIRDDRVNWFFALPAGRTKTFTMQLRAAYEGTYALPSVVAEAMYEPAVNGCTASGKAVVKGQ